LAKVLIKGTNYYQMYWFFEDDGVYRLGSLDPYIPTKSTKIEFDQTLEFDDTPSTPDYFLETWS